MSLIKFIAQENFVANMWGTGNPAWTVFPEKIADLTADHKKELASRLLSDLGLLRSKAIMLNTAKADLEALGQKVEWEYEAT